MAFCLEFKHQKVRGNISHPVVVFVNESPISCRISYIRYEKNSKSCTT